MKTLRLLAILLILAFSLSLFTACDVLEEFMGSTGDVTDNGDNTDGTDGPDAEKPDEGNTPGNDDNDDAPLEHIHSWDNGICKQCNKVCTHDWVSGTCGICDTDCNHTWVGGVCSTCGVDCTHSWGDGGICVKCGNECEHNFNSGYCTVCHTAEKTEPGECKHEWSCGVCTLCGYECEHEFDTDNDYTCIFCGVQAIVPPECKHEWADGVCIHCEEICSHVFSGDACEICGFINVVEPPLDDCQHAWENGVCQSCGKVCEHDFGNDVSCHICGELLSGYYILVTYKENEYKVRYEITLGEFISEYLGTTYEETVATGAYWMTVDWNYEKVTLEKDSYFMNYGMVLELYLIGGGVTPPAEECEHEWVDGYCGKCGNSCDHSYSDSVCTICGKVCDHSWWTSGGCGWCGLPCDHEWDGNWCVKCSFTCMHEGTRVDGVCTVCGDVCNHYWILDRCENCGMVCNHTFDGPTCTKCGYMSGGIDNPLTIYFEDTVYTTPYSASFQELFYLYSDLSYRLGYSDYEESLQHGYWVIVTDKGDVEIGEYTSLCEFGHEMTIAFRRNAIDECHHLYWNDGYCASCGIPCEHGAYTGGMCGICGMPCAHAWNNGQCMICYIECDHPDWSDGRCVICDMENSGGIPEGSIVFSVLIQEAPGSETVHSFDLMIEKEMSIMDMFYSPVKTIDGYDFHLPYESNYLIRHNGTALDESELYNVYITNGSQIFIYKCYLFTLESIVDGNTYSTEYKSPYQLTGVDLLQIMNMAGMGEYQVNVNSFNYDPMTFENSLFPLDSRHCHIRVESLVMSNGLVRLEILDNANYMYSYDAEGEMRLSDFFTYDESFHDFIWTLEYPDGTVISLDNFDHTLYFNSDYVDYNYGATVYRLDMKWNVFCVDLTVDDQYYGNLQFKKSDNLTARQIVESFGVYVDYENYEWMINLMGAGYSDLDMVITEDANIYAYDMRPYIELNVDGVSYKYNHNADLTLAQTIEIINSTYGTSFTFDGYIWYGYSNDFWRDVQITDPNFIVVGTGFSRTVTGKSHNTVNVYFTTDLGHLSEDGMMDGVIFNKGGEWYTPEIPPYIAEMTRGVIFFTGAYEYRVYNTSDWTVAERCDINSIEDLFALNLTEVTLYAKYEIDYTKLCGTYVRHGEIIFVTEDTISTYYSWSNSFSEPKHYTVTLSAGMINLTADDRSFDYNFDYLTNETSKIEDGAFGAVLWHDNGYIEMYLNYDEYLMALEVYQINRVTDKDGNDTEVSASGLYYIYASDKYYEY